MTSFTIRPDRRTILRASAALGGIAVLQGLTTGLTLFPSSAMAATGEISTMRSTAKSWLWAAEDFGRDGGYFGQSGVKVASNSSGRGVNLAALVGGEVDIVIGSPDSAMLAQAQGQPIKIIAGMVNKYASHIVIKKDVLDKAGVTEKSPVDAKIRAMKGLKLGTTGPGAAPDTLFRYLFGKVGIDPNRDAELVGIQGGGAAILAAMERNVIQGFCLSSPTADQAIQKFGGAYLFDMASNPPPDLTNFLYITAYTGEKTLQEKREPLLAYCKGLALALKAIHAEPAKFKSWAQGFLGLEADVFENAFASNSKIYMQTPVPTQAQFELNKQFVTEAGKTRGLAPLPASFGFNNAFDISLAQQAVASI